MRRRACHRVLRHQAPPPASLHRECGTQHPYNMPPPQPDRKTAARFGLAIRGHAAARRATLRLSANRSKAARTLTLSDGSIRVRAYGARSGYVTSMPPSRRKAAGLKTGPLASHAKAAQARAAAAKIIEAAVAPTKSSGKRAAPSRPHVESAPPPRRPRLLRAVAAPLPHSASHARDRAVARTHAFWRAPRAAGGWGELETELGRGAGGRAWHGRVLHQVSFYQEKRTRVRL